MDFLRRNKSSGTVPLGGQGPDPTDHAPDPESALLEKSRREQVRTAISHLEPEFREAIVLREIEGMPLRRLRPF